LRVQGKEQAPIALGYMCHDLAKTFDIEMSRLCVIKIA